MQYNKTLADRVRAYLVAHTDLDIQEKTMFNVLNFMVNNKTCVCVSGEKLMLRFDPTIQETLAERPGYETMLMKGKSLKGYCYFG
jgi:hypothetical protein